MAEYSTPPQPIGTKEIFEHQNVTGANRISSAAENLDRAKNLFLTVKPH